MYLNIYVPQLQHEQGIVWFFREHRGLPVPSAAVMSPMSRNFVAKLEGYAAGGGAHHFLTAANFLTTRVFGNEHHKWRVDGATHAAGFANAVKFRRREVRCHGRPNLHGCDPRRSV
jgi:hypothetical protein